MQEVRIRNQVRNQLTTKKWEFPDDIKAVETKIAKNTPFNL